MKYTTEQLEAIASKLREMPPVEKKKQEHSKQEAVRVLKTTGFMKIIRIVQDGSPID